MPAFCGRGVLTYFEWRYRILSSYIYQGTPGRFPVSKKGPGTGLGGSGGGSHVRFVGEGGSRWDMIHAVPEERRSARLALHGGRCLHTWRESQLETRRESIAALLDAPGVAHKS